MSKELCDGELVRACTEGKTWAWDTLVDRYRRLVYAIPLRAGLSEEDAADVFQAVFTSLFEHLHTLRDSQGLAKWLMTTAQRESWTVSRKRRREPVDEERVLSFWANDGQSITPEQLLARWVDQALVLEALERLGGPCRKLLWLLYFDQEELPYTEVSERMGIAVGSIGPTRARCLQKMRRILRTMGIDGDDG